MRYLFLLCILCIASTAYGQSLAQLERQCYGRFDNYNRTVKPIPYKVRRKRIPAGVRTFKQLVKATPRRKNVAFSYRTGRLKPRATFGTFGWERSVIVHKNKQEKKLGEFFVQGVSPESFLPSQLDWNFLEDLDDHHRSARGHNCISRRSRGRFEVTTLGDSLPLTPAPEYFRALEAGLANAQFDPSLAHYEEYLRDTLK